MRNKWRLPLSVALYIEQYLLSDRYMGRIFMLNLVFPSFPSTCSHNYKVPPLWIKLMKYYWFLLEYIIDQRSGKAQKL